MGRVDADFAAVMSRLAPLEPLFKILRELLQPLLLHPLLVLGRMLEGPVFLRRTRL